MADPRETQLQVTPKNRAFVFEKHGGPEVLELKELDTPQPADLRPGQVLVRVSADQIFTIESTSCPC